VLDAPTPCTIRADAPGGERSVPGSAVNIASANISLALLGTGTNGGLITRPAGYDITQQM